MSLLPFDYQISDARYAKGKKLIRTPSLDGRKTRAATLAGDYLKGSWTNREKGYVVSPTKALKFVELFDAGWRCCPITRKLYR